MNATAEEENRQTQRTKAVDEKNEPVNKSAPLDSQPKPEAGKAGGDEKAGTGPDTPEERKPTTAKAGKRETKAVKPDSQKSAATKPASEETVKQQEQQRTEAGPKLVQIETKPQQDAKEPPKAKPMATEIPDQGDSTRPAAPAAEKKAETVKLQQVETVKPVDSQPAKPADVKPDTLPPKPSATEKTQQAMPSAATVETGKPKTALPATKPNEKSADFGNGD
jgi:ribonuclease E